MINTGFIDNLGLIKNLTYREIGSRYRESIFGTWWIVLAPVLMLAIYTIFFGGVIGAKWVGVNGGTLEYSIILYAGLLVFNMFAECLTKSSSLILDNRNYIKKIVFPAQILAWVSVLVSLFHLLCGTLIWIVFFAIIRHEINITVLLYPFVVIIPLVAFCVGLSWLCCSIGVYVRDLNQFTPIFISVIMFTSPVFFPIQSLPVKYRWLFECNPLTFFIENARDVLYYGTLPTLINVAVVYAVGVFFMVAGYKWFEFSKRGFSDVL